MNSSSIDLLVDLLEESELGSLAKIELSAKLVNDFLWKLSFVYFDVLDVLSSIKLHFENANGFLILQSPLSELVDILSLGALLNLRFIVASVSGTGRAWLWLLLIALVWLLSHLIVLTK